MRRLFLALILVCAACDAPPAVKKDGPASASADKPKPAASKPPKLPTLNDPTYTNKAPEKFKAKFVTTKGDIVIEVTRKWAPRGADRFYNLVKVGYYNNNAFFRVVKDFVVQFGLHPDPKISELWRKHTLMDEMVKQKNVKGTITYARSTSDSRTTQVFINLKDNTAELDDRGFSPFGTVVEGMDVVEKLHSGYGEQVNGKKVLAEGEPFLKKNFPKLDYIKAATVQE